MKRSRILITLFALVAILGGMIVMKVRSDIAKRTPQMQAVENFYRKYMGPSQTGDVKDARKAAQGFFSKGLLAAWDQNINKCKETAATEVCGWGADGDVFLQAQDYDPNLNYENSKFRVLKFSDGFLEANFNVYPSKLKAGKFDPYYERSIRFFLIEEDGKWVVDDMAYIEAAGPVSVREMMKQENSAK